MAPGRRGPGRRYGRVLRSGFGEAVRESGRLPLITTDAGRDARLGGGRGVEKSGRAGSENDGAEPGRSFEIGAERVLGRLRGRRLVLRGRLVPVGARGAAPRAPGGFRGKRRRVRERRRRRARPGRRRPARSEARERRRRDGRRRRRRRRRSLQAARGVAGRVVPARHRARLPRGLPRRRGGIVESGLRPRGGVHHVADGRRPPGRGQGRARRTRRAARRGALRRLGARRENGGAVAGPARRDA
mmetsp:Transcript_22715/g.70238  ORF Transcript_22715/g.70238 Transcript_22715/m.70238 type:complete len:244 (+) Transcript_22715:587-1318(+)